MIEVVGVGAAGVEALDLQSRALVESASVVIGTPRLLASLALLPGQTRMPLPSPLVTGMVELIQQFDGQDIVVLASGDPLVSGIGSTLIRLHGAERVRIHPAVSAVALARARMRWPAESCVWVSLVSAPVHVIRRWMTPGARLILLSAGGHTPRDVAAELVAAAWPTAAMTVLANLGSDDETRLDSTAESWPDVDSPGLNIVAVQLPEPERSPAAFGTSPGLPDDAFEHDGQITKREIRAAALAALRPMPGQVLWDIGAGSGSIGIEWALHHPSCRTIAFERDPVRAARISTNAQRLGIVNLDVRQTDVAANSEDCLAPCPVPNAVFIGGGLSMSIVQVAWKALAPGGRLVAHAVTMESEAVAFAGYHAYGGTLRRINVEHAEPLGGYLAWRPLRPIVQWSTTKEPAA